jgi:hypothetical protein
MRSFIPVGLIAGAMLAAVSALTAQSPWSVFSAADDAFAVEFPNAPEATHDKIGDVSFSIYLTFWDAEEKLFQVSVYDIPGRIPAQPDEAFYRPRIADFARDGGKLIESQRMIVLAGHAAMEAEMTMPSNGASYLVDIVAAGQHLYLVASAGRLGHSQSAEAAHFRESFRILDAKVKLKPK